MSNPALQPAATLQGNLRHTNARLGFGHSGNQSHSLNQSSYHPRSPRNTAYHRLVEDNFEELELVWDSKYQKMYGYWRPHVIDVIQKYLDCGDPHLGFARVKCSNCSTEYLLPFSCKCRGFCPSCHQRRVVEFGDCVIAVQTFGELVNFNPHLHIIASNDCFTNNGTFIEGISPNANDLLIPFAKAVFKMLMKEKAISLAVINNMATWQHSGFNIHCGSPVGFSDTDAMERLARYIIRAPISQERLKYIPGNGTGKVVYEGKTTYRVETFSAIDFLARLSTHIPNKQEQSVRYYGYYSNKSRGMRAKAEATSLEADTASGTADNSPAIGDSTVDNIISLTDNRSTLFFQAGVMIGGKPATQQIKETPTLLTALTVNTKAHMRMNSHRKSFITNDS